MEKFLGKPLDECELEVNKAIEHAQSVFHGRYGDHYGASGSTSIDHKKTRRNSYDLHFPGGNP